MTTERLSYRVVFNSPLLKLAPSHMAAFTLGDTVHVRGPSIDPALLAHEGTHVGQYRQAGGALRGLLQWLLLFARHGYDFHPWELEARRVEAKVRKWQHRQHGASVKTRLFTRPGGVAGLHLRNNVPKRA